jgi:hypothetical protein
LKEKERSAVAEGIVYIFVNPAMPDYIKVGLTQQDDVTIRLRQLDNTSTPLPFECRYAARVPDCQRLERTLHFVFGEKRARRNREFFTANADLVKAIIELVAIADVTPTDVQQNISMEERAAIEETTRPKTTLQSLGLKPGEVLTFTKDRDITCAVASSNRVRFRDKDMSISGAALIAIHEMGYRWPTVNGFEYWEHDGKTLSNLRMLSANMEGEKTAVDA